MLAELRRIREALEGSQPLGFGVSPIYVFGPSPRTEGQNVPIIKTRFDRLLAQRLAFRPGRRRHRGSGPQAQRPAQGRQGIHGANRVRYKLCPYFLAAGLLELKPAAPKDPLALVVEDNAGSRARATVFCRVESGGVRMTPVAGKGREPQALYQEIVARFGFVDSYSTSNFQCSRVS